MLLRGRDTFRLEEKPAIYKSRYPLLAYRNLPESAAPQFVAELLAHFDCDRFTCPYIFVIMVMNPCEDWPSGGGRPFNGGFNAGGGLVEMSSYRLDHGPGFQSTLQHELGHSFGLMHVDAYGYSMQSNSSIMSYNPNHRTIESQPSSTPGRLIPEDIRALAANDRVFSELIFDAKHDVPSDYQIKPTRQLSPMTLPGEAKYESDAKKRWNGGYGFELFVAGKRVIHEPGWNRATALSKLKDVRKRNPETNFEARYNGHVLHLDEQGYQLFIDGRRAGHESKWTAEEGIENLRWNIKNKPNSSIEGRFDGVYLQWVEPTGYELFHNGRRVGHEITWTRQRGLRNLRYNQETHKTVHVSARFEGSELH